MLLRYVVVSLLLMTTLTTAVVPATASAPGPLATESVPDTPATESTPTVASVYPNPVAPGDRGEHVVVSVPDAAVGRTLTLSDGETTVSVPTTDAGVVAVASDPVADVVPAGASVVIAPASFALANSGERLTLRLDGRVVDTVVYTDAPSGERWRPRDGSWTWWPLGLSDRPVRSFGPACATAFVLPDDPAVTFETLRAADDRIFLAGYTFSSPRVADALVAAAARGVTVRVLVDDAPVGGRTTRAAATLDRLTERGVDVRVVGGPGARFAYHHPKYAVVDDRALVLTENWKPAGVGGRDSRGWGVRVDDAAVAAELATVFEADASARDATGWRQFRRGRTFTEAAAANGSFPTRFEPRAVSAASVDVVTAPENAESALVARLDGARDRIEVIQPTIGRRDHPFVRAALRAAERGVEVRILLSGAWYVEEENRALAAWLNDRASRDGLPLEARVATPRGRYGKIHAKGVVVDDTVVVGSLNWNDNAVRANREVALVLDSPTAAAYFRSVFDADWRGGGWHVRLGELLAAALALAAAVAVARRTVTFADDP